MGILCWEITVTETGSHNNCPVAYWMKLVLIFQQAVTPCSLSNGPRLQCGTRCVRERVTSSPCLIRSSFRNLFCRLVGSRLCSCSVRPHRVAWLQWMKPEWQIAWLQSPKILAFTEAIARKYVHLRAQAGGEKGSLASCALCSASLRPLCLFQRLLPSRDLTKQI